MKVPPEQPILKKRAHNPRDAAREHRRIERLKTDRLSALASQYGAVKGGRVQWREFATALATEKSPGLRIKDEPEWKDGLRDDPYWPLWLEVYDKLLNRQFNSVPAVLRWLTKQKSGAWFDMNPGTLKTRLYEVETKLNKRHNDAIALLREPLVDNFTNPAHSMYRDPDLWLDIYDYRPRELSVNPWKVRAKKTTAPDEFDKFHEMYDRLAWMIDPNHPKIVAMYADPNLPKILERASKK